MAVDISLDSFTLPEIQRFRKSRIWNKLMAILKDEVEVIHIEMAIAPKENKYNPVEGGKVDIIYGMEWYQGRLAEINTLINLPESIEGMIEYEEELEKKKSDAEDYADGKVDEKGLDKPEDQTGDKNFDFNDEERVEEKSVEELAEEVMGGGKVEEGDEKGDEEEGELEEGEELEDELEDDGVEDDLTDMPRLDLRRVIRDEKLDIKVYKNDTDDEIRAKIRELDSKDKPLEGIALLEKFAGLTGTTVEQIEKGEATEKKAPEKREVDHKDLDIVKELDLKADDFGNIAMTPETLNKVINLIARNNKEYTMQEAPLAARSAAVEVSGMLQATQDFFQNNPDITMGKDGKPLQGGELTQRKQLLRYVANNLQSKNPDKGNEWVLSETAKEVRTWIGRPTRTKRTQTETTERGSKKGPRNRFSNKGARLKKKKLSGEAAEVADTFS